MERQNLAKASREAPVRVQRCNCLNRACREITGEWKQPQSTANVLSKKRSYFGVLLMGFVLAADWIATLVGRRGMLMGQGTAT